MVRFPKNQTAETKFSVKI